MKRMLPIAFAGAILTVTTSVFAAPQASLTVENPQEAAQTVTIRDVQMRGDTVSGVVTNTSSHQVRDVGLLVRQTWFWNDERHPGQYSPGRASLYTVSGPIPAGGSVPFEYRMREPAPARSDGRFATTIEVMAFTEVGGAATSSR